MEALSTLRAEIDEIDARIAALIGERFTCTDKVGELKSTHRLPAVDTARESWQMARFQTLADANGVSPELLRKVFRLIVDEVVDRHRKFGAPATE